MKEIKTEKTTNFIAYSLPGQRFYTYHVVQSFSHNNSDLLNADFVISPFDISLNKAYYLNLMEGQKNADFECQVQQLSHLNSTDFDEYKNTFAQSKNLIKERKLEKIVLSKIKAVAADKTNPVKCFQNLINKYEDAFVYLFYINDICWIGATPELLLHRSAELYQTVALAGTQKVIDPDLTIEWTNKEKEEHGLIEKHLENSFNDHGVSYSKSKAFTQKAGSMVHIKSEISFNSDLSMDKILGIIHPGPAISGYDSFAAKAYLRDIEKHDRSFYAGFLGPLEQNNNLDLYVNLRCMQVFKNQYCLYLGGGLVKDSDLTREWEETELKASTLLSIIEMNE